MSAKLLSLLFSLVLLACDDEPEKPVYDGPLTFAPAPQCPSPHAPEARAYQESGGPDNAWLWWMTMHAITQPSYQTHHVVHHHYVPTPVYRAAPVTAPPRSRSWFSSKPAGGKPAPVPASALKPTTPGRAPAWSARPSPSFGYKPSVSRPASTGFRPSSSSFGGGRRGN